jgi:hypothetical protein
MLGFLYAWPINSAPPQEEDTVPPFVSTASFGGARVAGGEDWARELSDYSVWDCRHGRALLCDMDIAPTRIVVWDPMTGCRSDLLVPDKDYNGARCYVLRAAATTARVMRGPYGSSSLA